MSLVVDASVAAKWVLPEAGSVRAEELFLSGEALIAPSLVVAEIGNAICKRAVQGEMRSEQALVALNTAISLFNDLVPMESLGARAASLAIELRHPIYDCFYLALAERERATLITADEPLFAAARKARVKAKLL